MDALEHRGVVLHKGADYHFDDENSYQFRTEGATGRLELGP